jgi:bifunctional ADP-heptose synthase (sugar kinase/adenylyltransferase)
VLGNLAASLVVRQFGTATTSVREMRAALEEAIAQ